MLGKLLSTAVKIVTLPVDVAEITLDHMTGGNGSRKGLKDTMPMISDVRDSICKAVEKVDE